MLLFAVAIVVCALSTVQFLFCVCLWGGVEVGVEGTVNKVPVSLDCLVSVLLRRGRGLQENEARLIRNPEDVTSNQQE